MAACAGGLDVSAWRRACPRRGEIPFDAVRACMAVESAVAGRPVIFVKGALEALLPRCVARLDPAGQPEALDAAAVEAAATALAAEGWRVLAFARGDAALGTDLPASGLTFLGEQDATLFDDGTGTASGTYGLTSLELSLPTTSALGMTITKARLSVVGVEEAPVLERGDQPRCLRQRADFVETAVNDMDGDRRQHVDMVEKMPRGQEQVVREIMRLDLREAEREIGVAELARRRILGDHVRDHPFPQRPGQRRVQLLRALRLGRRDHVEDRLVRRHHVGALLDAGWPGEIVSAESGLHRVHVAVATLRKMGLGPVLVTEPQGYRIDASVVRVAA